MNIYVNEILSKINSTILTIYSEYSDEISLSLSNIVHEELNLSSILFLNTFNTFSIKHFNTREDLFIYKNKKYALSKYIKLLNRFSYRYCLSSTLDEIIDNIFNFNTIMFMEKRMVISTILSECIKFVGDEESRVLMVDNVLNSLDINFFMIIPLIVNSYRVGILVVPKATKITRIEKGLAKQIKSKAEQIIQNSEFFKKCFKDIEDINLFSYDMPKEIYKELYSFLIKINSINNINELRNTTFQTIKKVFNITNMSYYEVNENNIVPVINDEDEDIKQIVKNTRLNRNNRLLSEILNQRSCFIINHDDKKMNDIYKETFPQLYKNNSFMITPLSWGTKDGVIVLTKKDEEIFYEIESIILQTIVKHTVLKFKELNKAKELEYAKVKYKALYETLISLNSSNGLEQTLSIIAKIIQNLIGADNIVIFKITDDKQYLETLYSNEKVEIRVKRFEKKIKLGDYLIGKVCADGITRFENYDEYSMENDSSGEGFQKAAIAIPLTVKGEIYGGVLINRLSKTDFDTSDLETVLPFAQQAINAIYQANIAQEHKQDQIFYKTLVETITFISRNRRNLKESYKFLLDSSIKLLKATYGLFYKLDEAANKLVLADKLNTEKNKRFLFKDKIEKNNLAEWSAITNNTVMVIDCENSGCSKKIDYNISKEIGNISVIIVPILKIKTKNNSALEGIFILQKNEENFFDKESENLISNFKNKIFELINNKNIDADEDAKK